MFNPSPPFVQPPYGPSPSAGQNPYPPGSLYGPGGPGDVARWDEYMRDMIEARKAAAGFERLKLDEQLKDAAAGRANAMRIAQLQEQGRRYGVDVGARTEMARLQENARQFEASHGLEMAKAYTQFAQTPDLMFARNDFMSALGNVARGGGPAPYGSQGSPQPKRWEDFAALSGFGNVPAVKAGSSGGGGGSSAYGAGGGGGGGGGSDPRMTAASAVMKALPPSEGFGADGQDWEALRAIESLYRGAKPGSLERLGPARQKIAAAGMARLGYDPAAATHDYQSAGIGQGAAGRY